MNEDREKKFQILFLNIEMYLLLNFSLRESRKKVIVTNGLSM